MDTVSLVREGGKSVRMSRLEDRTWVVCWHTDRCGHSCLDRLAIGLPRRRLVFVDVQGHQSHAIGLDVARGVHLVLASAGVHQFGLVVHLWEKIRPVSEERRRGWNELVVVEKNRRRKETYSRRCGVDVIGVADIAPLRFISVGWLALSKMSWFECLVSIVPRLIKYLLRTLR